jgi:phosphoribosylaminoimidazole (AIR) synthetase
MEGADSDCTHALISPTRHWSVVIKLIIEALQERNIFHMLHGISMNTGGGATKIAHVGDGIIYHKIMPEAPWIFRDIQEKSSESWRNMFETFNCGVGIDIVGEDNAEFAEVMQIISEQTHINLHNLGVCEEGVKGQNKIILETPYGRFENY